MTYQKIPKYIHSLYLHKIIEVYSTLTAKNMDKCRVNIINFFLYIKILRLVKTYNTYKTNKT